MRLTIVREPWLDDVAIRIGWRSRFELIWACVVGRDVWV